MLRLQPLGHLSSLNRTKNFDKVDCFVARILIIPKDDACASLGIANFWLISVTICHPTDFDIYKPLFFVFLKIWEALRSSSFLAIASFLFLLGTMPLPPLLYYQRDVLKFSEDFFGVLGAFGFLEVGLGAIAFGIWFRQFHQNMLLKLAVFASVLSTFAIAFIFDKNSAILVQVFSNCAAIIAFLSLSEVFVRACPELIGGTFYACFVSVINLAATFGVIIGGWLYLRSRFFFSIVSDRGFFLWHSWLGFHSFCD